MQHTLVSLALGVRSETLTAVAVCGAALLTVLSLGDMLAVDLAGNVLSHLYVRVLRIHKPLHPHRVLLLL